jgi:hypothetical protein
MIGLNLSSALNSVITIYILIPFILIPQLLFSGVLVKYEKLHTSKKASSYQYVPFIGELMPARWSYEALAVEQFKNNRYERVFFPYDMEISRNVWYAGYLIPILEGYLQECRKTKTSNDSFKDNYMKIKNYMEEMLSAGNYKEPESLTGALNAESPDSSAFGIIEKYLVSLAYEFNLRQRQSVTLKDSLYQAIAINKVDSEKLDRLKIDYYNKGLATFVLNGDLKDKSVEKPKRIIRKYEPVFMPPTTNNGRAHFCAPFKMIGNLKIDTLWFNLIIVWLVSIVLYIALYFNLLRRILSGFDKSKRLKSDSSFLIIKEISSW